MKAVRRHISHLTLMIVATFAVQWMAIGFCVTPASAAAMETSMHATHGDGHAMLMPCVTDKMPPSQIFSCEHCDLLDTVSIFAAGSASIDKAPLVAVLAPARPVYQTVSIQSAPDFASLHGPPRSSSLIYSTSLRILR